MGKRDPHVLIVSTKVDVATDVVVRLLFNRGVRVTRFNTEDFPFDTFLTNSICLGSCLVSIGELDGAAVDLSSVTRVWYRRVRVPESVSGMSAGVYDFSIREARAAMLGTLLSLQQEMMSRPEKVWAAEFKPYQLAIAKSCGLAVLETVITNDPHEVGRAFSAFGGKMIVKPVRSGFIDLGGDDRRSVFTSRVLEEHLADVASARWSPSIYQSLIDKECDIRVTAVGERLFAAEINSQVDPDAVVDWRRTKHDQLPHRVADLPDQVASQLRELMLRLGLVFGAIDLIRTANGEYVFLEVNPNGQWLWIDDMLDTGISAAVAHWLCEVD